MNHRVTALDAAITRKKFVWEAAMQQMKELKQEQETIQQEFTH